VPSTRRRASFGSLVAGEVYKIRRQPLNWALALVPLLGLFAFGVICGLSRGLHTGSETQDALSVVDPLAFVLQFSLGAPLLLISARTVAQDYQLGTIRVLIGRGVGRVRLLVAKLVALGLVSALALAAATTIGLVLGLILVPGLPAGLIHLPRVFWQDAWLDGEATVLSLAACLLLGTSLAAASRSLSFSLAAAVVWMPIENLLVLLLGLAVVMTGKDFFRQLSAYLLTPNLNVLPQALSPWREVPVILATPLVDVNARHALTVTIAYLGIFGLIAILLTWRRDVQQ
jgi:ABC-2 type transport system permease protein